MDNTKSTARTSTRANTKLIKKKTNDRNTFKIQFTIQNKSKTRQLTNHKTKTNIKEATRPNTEVIQNIILCLTSGSTVRSRFPAEIKVSIENKDKGKVGFQSTDNKLKAVWRKYSDSYFDFVGVPLRLDQTIGWLT